MIRINSIVRLIAKVKGDRGVIGGKYKVSEVKKTDVKLCSIEGDDHCFYANPKNVVEDIFVSIPDWVGTRTDVNDFGSELEETVSNIVELLKSKNKAYGNTALNPSNVFSKLSATEAICARLDDKLARIKNKGINDKTEDTVDDLIGYLLLLKMSMKK
jgi:hypothetical protein|tara:strand:+ start:2795 stop:3268 length:474 start_codon:yes stop_codon:yes gene_type:complete